MQTTIVSWGNSQGIRIPKIILESVHLKVGDEVEIKVEGEALMIKKFEKRTRKNLAQRLEGFDGEYTATEWDTGAPVGLEVL